MSTVRNLPGKLAPPIEVKRPARERAGAATWSRWVRVLVSVAIVWHLFAVFITPFSIPPYTSGLVQRLALSNYVTWYIRPLYLNQGYHFFAPDPEATYIVRYRVVGADGKEILGQLPDLDKQWPRLRYHRYMMLANQAQLTLRGEPVEQRVRAMLRVYARELLREYEGTEARVEHVVHNILRPADVLDGTKLDDPRTYQVLAVEVQTARDLETPLVFPHLATGNSSPQAGEETLPRSGP